MKPQVNLWYPFGVGFLLGFCFLAIGMVIAGTTPMAIRADAIKHNAAHWEATPDGKSIFVWGPKPK